MWCTFHREREDVVAHDKNYVLYINEIKSERRIFPKGKFHTLRAHKDMKMSVIKTQIDVFLTLYWSIPK